MHNKTISVKALAEGYSPRKNYKGKEELKNSIEKEGLLEPLLVRKDGDRYIIIDGVMRFRIIKELGWEEVPCIIRDADDKTAAHISYLTNSEDLRTNLNPIEVALHIKEMRDRFGWTTSKVGGYESPPVHEIKAWKLEEQYGVPGLWTA